MQKAFDYIEKYHMLEAEDKIVVGVSGGADSLCLLFVLLEYQKRLPFSLEAVHVEHGIRGEASRQDADFVRELCGRLGVTYSCVSCDVPSLAAREKYTLEEAGRLARYHAFEEIRQKSGADKIAVAHNLNDQAETMLFQMARGSGLSGACGMRPVRGRVIRPLLGCSREEIEDYLRERHIAWRTDATNESLEYARNRLRHEALPILRAVNEKADRHLAALGEELWQIQDYMAAQVREAAERTALSMPGMAQIDAAQFRELPAALQGGVLRECMRRARCPQKDVGRRHIESILGLFEKQSGRTVALPGGWQAQRRFGQVILQRAEEALADAPKPFLLEIAGEGTYQTPFGTFAFRRFPYKNQIILQKRYTKWFDYDKIKGNLFLRSRRPGDFLVIDGSGRRKKLKEYLIEEKIAAEERGCIPLLACGEEILWVTGHRISEAYKITAETKNVLEVQRMEEEYGGEDRRINT